MNLTQRGKIYFLIALLSFVFAYLIVAFEIFPYLGISLSIILFTLLSYSLKKDKSKETKKYLLFTLLFASLILVRSEALITFLNFASSLFFGSLMLTSTRSNKLGFIEHALNPVVLVLKSVFQISDYYPEFEKKKSENNDSKTREILMGVLITIFILAIVLPLLAFSNPIFEKGILNTWNFLKLANIFTNLTYEMLFQWIVRLVFFFAVLFMAPKIISLSNKNLSDFDFINWKNVTLPLFIPKLVTSVVVAIFIATQIQYYLASPETLDTMGITLSQRSREVFAHLSIVAGVIFALMYNDKRKDTKRNNLTKVLFAEGIFLILMVYKSVFDYINSWGFTYKRLYGVTIATFLLVVMYLFIKDYLSKKPLEQFVRKVVATFGIFLFAVNVLNFDYLIYHYRQSSTGQGVDYSYLSKLSPDSFSYDKQIRLIEDSYSTTKEENEFLNKNNPWSMLREVERLQKKYSNLDIRGFNIFEYLTYKKIKDVDVEKYFKMYQVPYSES